MWPEAVAVISAAGWGIDSILVRLGMRKSNVVAAAFVSYVIAAGCFWLYFFFFSSLHYLRSPAAIYFVLSGCLQPLVARILYYEGLTRLGASRAGPLRGIEPLFSAAIAMVFLHEQPGYFVYLGTLLIVASVWSISWRRAEEIRWRAFDIVFPVGAALVAAFSQNLRKRGLQILPDPAVGITIATSTSLLLFVIFLLLTRRLHLTRTGKESLPFFVTAGLMAAGAQLLNFVALNRGEVSAMVPLLNTTPLFTVLLSSIFLREMEKVTARIVAAAVLMVTGVVIITLR
jgi:uncharacterized membrane protein